MIHLTCWSVKTKYEEMIVMFKDFIYSMHMHIYIDNWDFHQSRIGISWIDKKYSFLFCNLTLNS